MNTIGRINSEALQWLEAVPFQLWALSHNGGRRYGLMTTNISEVFNGVLKGARSLPVTALVIIAQKVLFLTLFIIVFECFLYTNHSN